MDIKTFKNYFSIKKILLLSFGASFILILFWLFGYQNGFYDAQLLVEGITPTPTSKTTSVTPTITSTTTSTISITPTVESTIQTFEDKFVTGFKFQYDSKDWKVESNEDLKPCNDIKCGATYARQVILKNTKYSQTNRSITLSVIFNIDQTQIDKNNKICFGTNDIVKLNNAWYKVRNPAYNIDSENRDKYWSRTFVRNESLNSSNCIKGSVNAIDQPLLKETFQGKQIFLDIELRNEVSLDYVNIADDIVKSITF